MTFMLQDARTGKLVSWYDPDFIPPPPNPTYPSGLVKLTSDPDQAMQFVDQKAALEAWLAVSTTIPFRPDGEPNRPLTAMSVWLVEKAS